MFNFGEELTVEKVWSYRTALPSGKKIFSTSVDCWPALKRLLGSKLDNHIMFSVKEINGYFFASDNKLHLYTEIRKERW